jgi:hypothetical protein
LVVQQNIEIYIKEDIFFLPPTTSTTTTTTITKMGTKHTKINRNFAQIGLPHPIK